MVYTGIKRPNYILFQQRRHNEYEELGTYKTYNMLKRAIEFFQHEGYTSMFAVEYHGKGLWTVYKVQGQQLMLWR